MPPTWNRKFWILAGMAAAVLTVSRFLSAVFSGRIILPQSFNVGPLVIHYYGIIMAAAAAGAFYFASKRAPRFDIGGKRAEDILFWLIIGGFIGARLYHVLSAIGYYWQYPADIFKVWNGGLSIYGAVLGGILTLWIYCKLTTYNLKLKILLDWLAPCVLLGQIIGRFGNLFNYEAFGYPTGLPWKMFVPLNFRPESLSGAAYFHPWFLYEILGNLVILFFLLKSAPSKYKKSRPGGIAFFYLLLYNLLRFCLEFLRIDSTFIYGYRLNALVSLSLALLAAAALICQQRHVQASQH